MAISGPLSKSVEGEKDFTDTGFLLHWRPIRMVLSVYAVVLDFVHFSPLCSCFFFYTYQGKSIFDTVLRNDLKIVILVAIVQVYYTYLRILKYNYNTNSVW